MNTNEFFKQLAQLPLQWNTERNTIRTTIKGKPYCPITALCFMSKNKKFIDDDYLDAGNMLGLPKHVTEGISIAADTNCPFTSEEISAVKKFRKKLVKAMKNNTTTPKTPLTTSQAV